MNAGNGYQFRARGETDAKLFMQELASRGGGKRPPRRQQRIVLGLAGLVPATWALWSLLTT